MTGPTVREGEDPSGKIVILELDETEAGFIAWAIRSELKRKRKQQRLSRVKYGDDYDSSAHDAKLAFLQGMYDKTKQFLNRADVTEIGDEDA